MAGMGYSLETKSGTSAAATANLGSDNSGWTIQFGDGTQTATAAQALPQWVYVAAAIGAAVWLLKRKA